MAGNEHLQLHTVYKNKLTVKKKSTSQSIWLLQTFIVSVMENHISSETVFDTIS